MNPATEGKLPLLPVVWVGIFTLVLACGPLLPAEKIFATRTQYLPVHIALEFVTMAVSAMVFALGWNLRRRDDNSLGILLAVASLAVALIDLAHTLSYQGMPDLVTPSSPEKAINFWLTFRFISASALLAASLVPLRRWSLSACNAALATCLAAAGLAWWIGLYHADILPRTFIPDQGLTPFKIGAEFFMAGIYAIAAFLLFRRAQAEKRNDFLWLATASWVFSLAGLYFTLYRDVTDLFNLLGHIYMAVAYVMVYRALFVAGVAAPYEALAREQALLRSLIDSVPDLIFFKDRESAYLGFNKAFADYCGRNEEEMRGRNDFAIVPPSQAEQRRRQDLLVLERGRAISNEEWIDTPDGRRLPLETLKTPYRGPRGELLGIIGVSRDITERKKNEAALEAYRNHLEELVADRTRELEAARAEAERLSRVKGDFLANMSHEIRTPLNAILGLAQVGERQQGDRKARESFRRIVDSGQTLLGVIDDVLDFSKIEAEKLILEKGRVDLAHLIDHGVELVAVRAFAKGLDFRVIEDGALPAACSGDFLRLSQVLINLLTNAVKFTEKGQVSLEARRDGDTLVFRVGDTGIGMTREQMGRLFTPFEQADGSTTRRFGGSGLGLTICKRLIDLMDGEIRVISEMGTGSTFEIRLPLKDPEPALPAPAGLIVLSRFPPQEAHDLIAALRTLGAKAVRAADDAPFPEAATLVAVPGEALESSLFRQQVKQALDQDQRVVAILAPDKESRLEDLGDAMSVLLRPIRPRQLAALLSEKEPAGALPPAAGPRLRDLAILAAEDNPVNRLVLEDILGMEGARLTCVQDGRLALERLLADGETAYDLVLTDIQMPGMDGYELTRRIHEAAPGLPVVGITAHAMAEERTRCLEAGMVEHIAKPIDVDKLVAAIRQHSRRPPAAAGPAQPPLASAEPRTGDMQGAIDWTALEARYRGRQAFTEKLLGIVLDHNAEAPSTLRAAAGAGDLKQIAFLAHGLKAMAGNIAAPAVEDLALQAEQAARRDAPEAAGLAANLAGELDRLLEEIREHLATEKAGT